MAIYHKIKATLTGGGIDDGEARAIALMLLEELCGMSSVDVLMGREPADTEAVEAAARRVAEGEPVQYVLGKAVFCGLTFKVAPGVLIPRVETEQLVIPPSPALPLKGEGDGKLPLTDGFIGESNSPLTGDSIDQGNFLSPSPFRGRVGEGERLLDLCTGSGCIAIALAKRMPEAQVVAVDISDEALAIARENAAAHGVDVRFLKKDILAEDIEGEYDMIVSNPPYICSSEAEEMERNVLEHEPHIALFVPDDDPQLFYRRIADIAQSHLKPYGTLALEINRRFGKDVVSLLREQGFTHVELQQDLFGNDRIVRAIKG